MLVSVKVMRSYDYCHFEATLTQEVDNLDQANELRKQAAILVDEAVRQYKIAKKKELNRDTKQWQVESLLKRIEHIKSLPPSDMTVEDAALLRSYEDKSFWNEYKDDEYYYSDPERDHHFSMLEKFKEVTVKA